MKLSSEPIPQSIVDLAATADIVGSEEDAKFFMDLFIKSIPETKRECEAAVAAMDAKELRGLCHKIKGGTAYFIVPNVIEKLSVLHNLLRKEPESIDKWLSAYDAFAEALDELYITCLGPTTH